MSSNGQAQKEKAKAAAYATLLLRALPLAESLEEAVAATEVALSEHPDILSSNPPPPALKLDAFFSHDIFNKKAQRVLDRALRGARELSSSARRALDEALKIESPAALAQALVRFIGDYRIQLASLLGTTNLAALLEGASEVAGHFGEIPLRQMGIANVPPPPPTLPPDEALALISRLRKLSSTKQAAAIYDLPAEQQAYVGQALAQGPPTAPPHWVPSEPPGDDPGKVQFPIIEEAARELAQKNVVTRSDYDRLDAASKAKAFTVAGIEASETLTKVRDALATNVAEGVGFDRFRRQMAEGGLEGTFLSLGHMETIFRTSVQAAFSDGQMNVLKHPFIRKGFPYGIYSSIHDDRRRHDHGALEHHGIQGTNIYRLDDPVFNEFRPPWDWNDRCSWFPITVKHAAEKGIKEAQEWLETGREPSPPAYVQHPPFSAPTEFRRAMEAAPLSIQLSMQPVSCWESAPLSAAVTDLLAPQAPATRRRKKRRRPRSRVKRCHLGLAPIIEAPEGGQALSLDAMLATDPSDWQAYKGKRGAKGWKNIKTGRVLYQVQKPGVRKQPQDQERAAKHPPAAKPVSKPRRAQPGAPGKPLSPGAPKPGGPPGRPPAAPVPRPTSPPQKPEGVPLLQAAPAEHPMNRLRSQMSEATFAGQKIRTIRSTQDRPISSEDHVLVARAHAKTGAILKQNGHEALAQAHFAAARWHNEAGRRKQPLPIAAPRLSPGAAAVHKSFGEAVDQSVNRGQLSSDKAESYKSAMSNVLGRLSDRAVQHLSTNLQRSELYDSPQALTDSLARMSSRMAEKLKGKRAFGAFAEKTGTLHLDGEHETSSTGVGEAFGYRRVKETEGTYAHELAHAVDGNGKKLSSSPEWQEAFREEIQRPLGKRGQKEIWALSKYGASVSHEGWAEFGRLVWGEGTDLVKVQQRFPKAFAYWQKQGLIR